MESVHLRRRVEPDLVAGLLLFALAMVTGAVAAGYGLTDIRGRTGPGAFPLIAACLLGVLAVALIVRSVNAGGMGSVGAGTDPGEPEAFRPMPNSGRPGWVTPAIIVVLIAYIALIPSIGFAASSALLVFATMRAIERQSTRISFAFALVSGVSCWLIFERALDIPLPGWSW